MKSSLAETRKNTLKTFEKSFEKRFIIIAVAFGFILSCSGYFLARYVVSRQSHALDLAQASVFADMQAHDTSLMALREAEASVSSLKLDGIDSSSVDSLLSQMITSFSGKKYSHTYALRDQIVSESARLREVDAELSASYSARLVTLQKKYQDYNKQGVKVATLAGEIASISAEVASKKYAELPSRFGALDRLLDSLLFLKKEADKKAALATAVAPVPAQSSGGVTYERKVVNTSIGPFTADILTVDLNRVKVKTYTANENDCANDCPVKPLASFVTENGGIAGINGTYFCPPDYSQCAGVKNSFNTLVFDYRSKHYLNSAQNQYSVNPLIAFYNDGAHFYTQALGYGRDTSANGVISNHPTLVHNGGVATQVNLDAKSSGKGTRGGIGFNGKTLWAVVTRNATVPESGYVFTALGAQYALNLDGGGSTALYFGGYKVGPGRLLPNAIVFGN